MLKSSLCDHRIDFDVNGDNVTHFNSFGVEYIPKQIKQFIGNINIKTNVYRIQAKVSVICEYFLY